MATLSHEVSAQLEADAVDIRYPNTYIRLFGAQGGELLAMHSAVRFLVGLRIM